MRCTWLSNFVWPTCHDLPVPQSKWGSNRTETALFGAALGAGHHPVRQTQSVLGRDFQRTTLGNCELREPATFCSHGKKRAGPKYPNYVVKGHSWGYSSAHKLPTVVSKQFCRSRCMQCLLLSPCLCSLSNGCRSPMVCFPNPPFDDLSCWPAKREILQPKKAWRPWSDAVLQKNMGKHRSGGSNEALWASHFSVTWVVYVLQKYSYQATRATEGSQSIKLCT